MLKFNNVSFNYDKQIILDKFNVKFHDKKINCLIGPSGSGKTTILKLIANMLSPQSGKIINNNKKISFIFQEDRLIEEINVYENLELVIKNIYEDPIKRKKIILDYLKVAELENIENLYPHELSGSMRQRVSIIRGFIYPNTLLLLDEPFMGLDINIKKKLVDLFIKLWKKNKQTVILVSHDIEQAIMGANHVYVLSNKPIKVLRELNIHGIPNKRHLFDKKSNTYKKIISELAEKW